MYNIGIVFLNSKFFMEEKQMKRILALIITLCLLACSMVIFSACGGDDTETPGNDTTPPGSENTDPSNPSVPDLTDDDQKEDVADDIF